MSSTEPTIKKNTSYILAGDVGGTKTILGLFVAGKKRPLARWIKTFSSQDEDNLEDMVKQMLHQYPAKITSACFGVAGPVLDGRVQTTNLPWVVSEEKLSRQFGWERVRLINDLSATAMAVPLLEPREVFCINHVPTRKPGNIGLVAPGTGFGEAMLIRLEEFYVPIASEGGHGDFAPSCDKELDLWRYLHEIFGHVSVERVISGPGLVNIYNWLKSRATLPETPEVREAMQSSDAAKVITHYAIEGNDPLCKRALRHFCRILGSVAGNLALTGMTTGGMFLGGGIPVKILPALQQGDFIEAFYAKGRIASLMRKIPVRVIRNEQAALLGAAQQGLLLR